MTTPLDPNAQFVDNTTAAIARGDAVPTDDLKPALGWAAKFAGDALDADPTDVTTTNQIRLAVLVLGGGTLEDILHELAYISSTLPGAPAAAQSVTPDPLASLLNTPTPQPAPAPAPTATPRPAPAKATPAPATGTNRRAGRRS